MSIYQKNNSFNEINPSKIISIEGEVISSREKPFENELFIKTKKITTPENCYELKEKLLIKTKEKKEFLNGENVKIKVSGIKEIDSSKNPFEFNYKKFMQRKGIFFLGIGDEIKKLNKDMNLKLFFSYLRKKIEKRIEKYTSFNPDVCELIKLLTVGNDDPPNFLKELGIKTGIYHLFVISGFHIAFLIFLLKIIFIPFQRLNNIKPKFFPSLILFILWFYNFLCGFRIPITRAVLMVSLYLISEILEREIDGFTSLIFSCILLLFINPTHVYSTTFLLSYISTGGILTISKKLNIFKKNNFFIDLLTISLSAQLFILPILFYNFSYFYPLGIINNLIFTPFVGLITITSFISIIIPFLYLPLNFIICVFLKCLVFASNFSPQIFIYFPLSYVFLYYLIFFITILKLRKKIKIFLLLPIILFFFTFSHFPNKNNKKEIVFFSSKNPLILVQDKNKGILIIKGKIYEYKKFKEILLKFKKREKLNICKIILFGDDSIGNLFWLFDLSKEIDMIGNFKGFVDLFYKELKINTIEEKIKLYDIELNIKNKNLTIQFNNFIILIFLNEIFDEQIPMLNKTPLIIYPAEFKDNKKNVKVLNELKPFFYIIPKDIKKFENLKSLCKNYYLNKSAIIVDLKTGIPYYWKNDKRRY